MTEAADKSVESTDPAATSPGEAGVPVPPGAYFQRCDHLSFGITALVVLIVYLATLAPEVTLEDSGMLAASASYAGVAHPPGCPVWSLYSWLFVKCLPFSNVAWRVAVGSAVAAALACGLVALLVSRGGAMLLENSPSFASWKTEDQKLLRGVCGFAAGAVLGLSGPVWREAVIVDTWALSALLFAATICLFTRWMVRPGQRRFIYGAFFLFGLLLTSNQEYLALTPAFLTMMLLGDRELGRDLALPVVIMAVLAWAAGEMTGSYGLADYCGYHNVFLLTAFLLVGVGSMVIIDLTRRYGVMWKQVILCGGSFLLGLSFYFSLPLVSLTNPPMNWGYPRTVEGFFHLITRGQFEGYHPTDNLGAFWDQFGMLAGDTASGFGWPYFVFTLLPFCLLLRAGGDARKWLLGLMAVFVCAGPIILVSLNPMGGRAAMDLIQPHFIPMYTILAVWTGLGLMVVGSRIAKPRPTP